MGKTLDFIREHQDADVRKLALQGTKDPEVDLPFALDQIAGRQKARQKIPSWAATDGIVYPSHLSMEQCSSERTARYKAGIVAGGQLMVDLTAGFGVDLAFMSKKFTQAVHVERQEQLCAISQENYRLLGLDHIKVVCGDGTDYLHTLQHADLIFIDPARRDDHGGRTYGIADCTPNVLELLDELKEKADTILIKLSPMLDWQKAVADIGSVSEVHIVSVDNECKELLVFIEERGKRKEESGKRKVERDMLRVVCVNLLSDGSEERFEFSPIPPLPSTNISLSSFHFPLSSGFLYVPNASLMKAGCFQLIASRFGISQLDKNSHLFVSDSEIAGFPGRTFIIDQVTSLNKRELKAALAGITHANIAVRNFPMPVDALRRRLKLKDGGDTYIFATTIQNQGHQLFVCRKKS